MKQQEQNQLLNEVLGGTELEAFRQQTLERGLAHLRRQTSHRHARRLGLAVFVAVLLAVLLLAPDWRRATSRSFDSGKMASSVTIGSASRSAVKFISDEELFALFPDRSLALIGKPGQQELVFLDSITGKGNLRIEPAPFAGR